jgi:hypothetical protein
MVILRVWYCIASWQQPATHAVGKCRLHDVATPSLDDGSPDNDVSTN